MNRDIILVVDGDRAEADNIAWNILPIMGYEAMVAYNARSALSTLRKHCQRISLMLIDLKTPDTGGWNLLEKIYEDGYRIPSIMIADRRTRRVTVDSFRWGLQDYFLKPLDIEELSAVISRCLSEEKSRQEMAELTDRLREQENQLSTLMQVSKRISSTPDVDLVLQNILESAVALTHADLGFLGLINAARDRIDLKVFVDSEDGVNKVRALPMDDAWINKALIAGYPIRVRQSEGQVPFFDIGTGELHNYILAPLFAKAKSLGVLMVGHTSEQTLFSENDESLMATLADYAAITLENLNLQQKALHEIAERERLQTALEEKESRLEPELPGLRDGTWSWDLKTNRIYYSPSWKIMLGYSDQEIGDRPDDWFKRVHPDHIAQIKIDMAMYLEGQKPQFVNEHKILHKDGTYRWVLSQGLAEKDEDGVIIRVSGTQYDATALKSSEEEMLRNAFFDPLTGLPNQASFKDLLDHTLVRSRMGEGFEFGILHIDLDNFRQVSIDCDAQVGDEVIVQVAQILERGLRPSSYLAHFGEDDFAILLADMDDLETITGVAIWIIEQFYSPFQIRGYEVLTSASIGIVMSAGYQHAEEMLRDAKIALYAAKEDGGGKSKVFDPSMRAEVVRNLSLETDFQSALENDEFTLSYLPVVALETGALIGLEALVRWQHPRHGKLNPIDFIASAEDAAMITKIDCWVLRKACTHMRRWQTRFNIPATISVSVNISDKHVCDPGLFGNILQCVQETGLEPENLKLEISESALIENDEEVTEFFKKLSGLGIQILLDDFEIGYSSLGKLSRYPINALKIKQSYVRKMAEVGSHLEFLQGILTLAKKLNASAIAEGIETEDEYAILREFGCQYGQGFYISEPLVCEEVEAVIRDMGGNYTLTNHWP